uniref:Fucose-specific lectin n=1 Tax=Bionectria ochroleuca TaxID=29856 RepID=A0A8H7NKV1_BIOOC
MRDDERYPTVVEPDAYPKPAYPDIPEVIASSGPDIQGHDKVSVPEKDTHPPSDESGLPEVKRVCGSRRKRIIILVTLVIFTGAILGGVLGGLAATGRLGNKKTSFEVPSPIPSSITNSPQKSGPISKTQRGVAASISSGVEGSDVQIFYQALNATAISYRRIVNDEAKAEQKASLSIEPAWSTPMTAAAINGSDPLRTQLFYLSIDNDNRTSIVEAMFECQGDSESFSTVSNTVISGSVDRLVHPETKLSALRLGDGLLRVFYQQTDSSIHALGWDDKSGWYGNRVRQSAYPGTAIAVVAAERKTVHLFYVGLTSMTLRVSIYDDQLGPKGVSVEVDGTPSSDWRPTNSLTGIHVAGDEPFRCYWSQPNNGDIYSY